MTKLILVISLLLMSCSGCASMFARTTRLAKIQSNGSLVPDRGLRVTEVFPDSPAAAAGIQTMDVITKYGEFDIIDDAGFFAAKNHYEQAKVPTVEIVVYRASIQMSARVSSGWLGVQANDNDKVSQQFLSLMTRINTMRQIPEYQLDREFKGQFNESPAKILEKAKALIDEAERAGTLTPAQILLDRIYMILDDAPIADQQRQAVLLRQLIATQPLNYIQMLGNDKFFETKHYRPAIACFTEHLKKESDDVSIRLNLGIAYNAVGMYEEGEQSADYVFEHKLGLSQFGHDVAYQVKAVAALGLKDYQEASQYAEKAYAIEPTFYPISIMLLAAAQKGDVRGVDRVSQLLEEGNPEQFFAKKLQLDAAKAYALSKANQTDKARTLVRKWKDLDRSTGKVIECWHVIPGGSDLSTNWSELMQQ